jgi:hypothetical protein
MVGSRPTQSANYGVGSNYVNHLYYGLLDVQVSLIRFKRPMILVVPPKELPSQTKERPLLSMESEKMITLEQASTTPFVS